MEAIIYKSTGSWYTAGTGESFISCRIRGKFKNDVEITSTNPVAVGDRVELEPEGEDGHAVIREIHPRKNYMVRVSPHHYNQMHVIASNLDQALLVATLKEPRTSLGFIDRFLVTAEAYHIRALILFNKADQFTAGDQEKLDRIMAIYQEAGYGILVSSATTGLGREALRSRLTGLTTLFAGHSGSGKSTLVNLLLPGTDQKTNRISGWSGKGMHTTTFAEMFDLPGSGKVIDTPGIREYGLVEMAPPEVSHYFPEMRDYISGCRFSNCLHVEEPGCEVKKALEEGKISPERYVSYLSILESLS